VDGQHDADVVRRSVQAGHEPGDRSAHLALVVEDFERKDEAVLTLAEREPLRTNLAERSPRTRRERLAVELRERLRRAEAAACPADEQDPGQVSRRQGSV
jgi:hypothetical protein